LLIDEKVLSFKTETYPYLSQEGMHQHKASFSEMALFK
jgi:hypothetical protein